MDQVLARVCKRARSADVRCFQSPPGGPAAAGRLRRGFDAFRVPDQPPKTLSTKASRGGGPPYYKFGSRALYRWADALAWAEARLGPPRCSTSEATKALGAA